MSLFRHLDYRAALKELLETRKQLDPSWTYQRVAEGMRIQKSYLSQVLHGRAELNSDQLYLLIQLFELDDEEAEYLELLLEHARSALNDRKASLLARIKAIQSRKMATDEYLDVAESGLSEAELTDYYLDAYNQLVHVCLSQRRFRQNPQALAEPLGLHPDRVHEILVELQKLKLIEIAGDSLKVVKRKFHLPKNSRLFRSWKTQVRQMALQRSMQNKADDTYNFSVIFSCTEQVRNELQEKFFEFIQDAQKKVSEAKPEHVYQLNFDLVSWI